MKIFWILALAAALCATARATPLEDKIKGFTESLKSPDAAKHVTDPMMASRMSGMAAQFQSTLLAQDNDPGLESQVRQIMAMCSAEGVQAAGKDLLDELATRKKARVDALTTQANEVLGRVSDILIKAQKTQELDAILGDLQSAQKSPRSGYGGYDQETQAIMGRLSSAYQFVAQWQDYLSARNSGNTQEAQNALRNLLNNRPQGDTTLVPRSEILARQVELASAKTPTAGNPDAKPNPATTPAVDETAILAGVKTVDDIDQAVKSLKVIQTQNNDVAVLSQMLVLYAQAKNGLPVTIDFTQNNYGGGNQSPELERIRSMLLVYLLPHYIGSSALAFNPDETVVDYLKRSTDAAVSKQDWPLLQRIIDARIKIARTQGYPAGTRSFITGLNQEIAGQYALAVPSYLAALNQSDDYTPTSVVGDRLAAIKKDHPAEYEEGVKKASTPPSSNYYNPYIRPGMSGYSVPGMPGVPVGAPTPAPATMTNSVAAPAAPAPAPPTPPAPAKK